MVHNNKCALVVVGSIPTLSIMSDDDEQVCPYKSKCNLVVYTENGIEIAKCTLCGQKFFRAEWGDDEWT